MKVNAICISLDAPQAREPLSLLLNSPLSSANDFSMDVPYEAMIQGLE